jgi:hypothetical protein
MNLKDYFDSNTGIGVLSTSDDKGHVDAAIYSRPHIFDDGTIAFIMRDRLSHKNLQSNSYAAYLFKEDRKGYKGKRLYLTKVKEEQDSELLFQLRRRDYSASSNENDPKYLVFFKVDNELPLIGPGEKE